MEKVKVARSSWTFLTNHAHVLLFLADNSSARMRDIASEVGITERAVHHIIVKLEADGYLEHIRDGRRNLYKVFTSMHLRHTIEKHRKVNDLILLIKK
jgi:DNA-binding MarR family transcriptional regulator